MGGNQCGADLVFGRPTRLAIDLKRENLTHDRSLDVRIHVNYLPCPDSDHTYGESTVAASPRAGRADCLVLFYELSRLFNYYAALSSFG